MADTPTSNDLEQIANAVRAVSPSLAQALGGPSAGIVVAALGRCLLQDVQASPNDILTASKNDDPATQNAILAAEESCQLRLRESGSGLAQLSPEVALAVISDDEHTQQLKYGDTEGARARQIATHDLTNSILAYVVSACFFLLVVLLMVYGDKATTQYRELLFTMLGIVGTGWANIIGFYFGSSAGSAQKTQALTAALSARQQQPQPQQSTSGPPRSRMTTR
ncbi:hypothetical protein LMG28688_05611 [Paraburkholderia caffeinitolerans]|uniref:Uncharacterized protein n=1 Tax=Paraburkholderia caffeinitolerans TaxID=1723730 RepID=A0A6J5GLP1_9BURK|nr:hypothetical protein [Paraburkholderia caffeinitolerans]CAB3802667.1 hypothetical protein LMG28688_05611 [Paraburkholderia caffeinitolerans]